MNGWIGEVGWMHEWMNVQVAVNALLGDTAQVVDYGSALMANLATKEVKAVVGLNIKGKIDKLLGDFNVMVQKLNLLTRLPFKRMKSSSSIFSLIFFLKPI